jgi:hypothetical protein
MTTYSEDEQLGTPSHPYLLVHRRFRFLSEDAPDGDLDPRLVNLSAMAGDRMTPAVSGLIAGFVGGAAALGLVHGQASYVLGGAVAAVTKAHALDPALALGIVYAAGGAAGALVGAMFAVVTRYLRKWLPLLIWALVFFVSLAMLILAYGRVGSPALARTVLLATALFAALVSFSLPIRRRH